jgi:hypothetical protein
MPSPSSRPLLAVLLPFFLLACSDDKGGGPVQPPAAEPPTPLVWTALPQASAPSPRYQHTAIWTGSKMIIWGGDVGGSPPVTQTGAAYDPKARTWTPISMQGAPSPRHSHTAVWTGSKMLVWGGYGATDYAQEGGVYDPATDTWSPMSTAGQPGPRNYHSAVWAGARMVVWGGIDATNKALGNGGMYDPGTDTWFEVNAAGKPAARFRHGAASTGTEMILWGGNDSFDWRNDGARFSPAASSTGVWLATTPGTGAPSGRELATTEWTGKELLVWGGWFGGPYLSTGGLLDLASGTWTATSEASAPSPRAEHASVWAKDHLVVWGGCNGDVCAEILADGGQFVPGPGGGTWYPAEAQAELAGRRNATAVFTGESVIVWGGRTDKATRTDSGAEAPL